MYCIYRCFNTQNHLYPFQNLSLGFILQIFLKFRKFQPRYSYKIYSYIKKGVYQFSWSKSQNGRIFNPRFASIISPCVRKFGHFLSIINRIGHVTMQTADCADTGRPPSVTGSRGDVFVVRTCRTSKPVENL